MEEEHLSEAAIEGDALPVWEKVHQDLGCSDGGKADVGNRQIPEQEVHGGVKARLTGHGDHDEKVPQQSCHIHHEKEKEQQHADFTTLGQAKENKLFDPGVVFHLHQNTLFLCFFCFKRQAFYLDVLSF